MITLPYQKGVFKVRPEDIVFETHHTGRDVTEAGAEETPYEKFFASAMKKFGVGSPIELSPEDTKKFFNYVDKNWEAEEETDEDANEVAPEFADAISKVSADAIDKVMDKITGAGNEDVTTGKVGKKDKGSYQHAYKLALKKYKIHSADELDTPEERKGFTDYVDRLWKKGDIHRDKKEASIDTDEAFELKKLGSKVKSGASSAAKKVGSGVKKTAGAIKKGASQIQADARKKADDRKAESERKKKERDEEQEQKQNEREQKQKEREREQKADDNGGNGGNGDDGDNGDNGDPDDPKDPDNKKAGKFKTSALGKITTATQKYGTKYQGAGAKEASIPEGVKKNSRSF